MMKFLPFLLALVTGCASVTAIKSTGPERPAVMSEKVRIYSDRPPLAQSVGIIEGHFGFGFTGQQDTQKTVDAMRKRAGAMGANGLVIRYSMHDGQQSNVCGEAIFLEYLE